MSSQDSERSTFRLGAIQIAEQINRSEKPTLETIRSDADHFFVDMGIRRTKKAFQTMLSHVLLEIDLEWNILGKEELAPDMNINQIRMASIVIADEIPLEAVLPNLSVIKACCRQYVRDVFGPRLQCRAQVLEALCDFTRDELTDRLAERELSRAPQKAGPKRRKKAAMPHAQLTDSAPESGQTSQHPFPILHIIPPACIVEQNPFKLPAGFMDISEPSAFLEANSSASPADHVSENQPGAADEDIGNPDGMIEDSEEEDEVDRVDLSPVNGHTLAPPAIRWSVGGSSRSVFAEEDAAPKRTRSRRSGPAIDRFAEEGGPAPVFTVDEKPVQKVIIAPLPADVLQEAAAKARKFMVILGGDFLMDACESALAGIVENNRDVHARALCKFIRDEDLRSKETQIAYTIGISSNVALPSEAAVSITDALTWLAQEDGDADCGEPDAADAQVDFSVDEKNVSEELSDLSVRLVDDYLKTKHFEYVYAPRITRISRQACTGRSAAKADAKTVFGLMLREFKKRNINVKSAKNVRRENKKGAVGGDTNGQTSKGKLSPEDFEAMGVAAVQPTRARPGSAAKVLMVAARYAAGMPLWHEDDSYDHTPSRAKKLTEQERLIVEDPEEDTKKKKKSVRTKGQSGKADLLPIHIERAGSEAPENQPSNGMLLS